MNVCVLSAEHEIKNNFMYPNKEFIIDQWENIEPDGTVTYYRLIFCEDEKIHLKWKPTPDEV